VKVHVSSSAKAFDAQISCLGAEPKMVWKKEAVRERPCREPGSGHLHRRRDGDHRWADRLLPQPSRERPLVVRLTRNVPSRLGK
jgi:hypothetical protein